MGTNCQNNRRTAAWVRFVSLLVSLMSFSICANAQSQDYVVLEKKALVVLPINVGGNLRFFVLTKEVTEPKKKQGLSYDRLVFFRLKRYTAINERLEGNLGETIWQQFSHYPVGNGTYPGLHAKAEVKATGDGLYIALAVSNQHRLLLKLFEIDVTRAPQTDILPKFTELQRISSLSLEDQEKPLSTFNKEFPVGECGVNRIDAIVERDDLLIYADREARSCSPAYFRYDLKTKQWAEVSLQEPKTK